MTTQFGCARCYGDDASAAADYTWPSDAETTTVSWATGELRIPPA